MAITKISKTEVSQLIRKQDEVIDKKIDQITDDYKKADEFLSQKIEKERMESENLLRKELEILKQQIEFVVSGIKDIKDKM